MVDILEIKLNPYGEKYNGKHDGWAYQLLDDNYQSFHLGVCCKDFLQDIIWSELTQKEMQIYNQTSKYHGIIDKQDTLKLALYPYNFGEYSETIDNLEELSLNLQAFLNEIEVLKQYNLSLVTCTNNILLIEFSKQWIEKPYLFSLFTLLCRIGLYYHGELESYIANPYETKGKYLDNCDLYYLKNYFQNILDIIHNVAYIEQKSWNELTHKDDVHDSGLFCNIHKLKKCQ